jgi:predicted O-methyltransferase YrrM
MPPEHWRMFDVQTAELEVLEFLKGLVTTVRPKLVVETGTFMGISTLWIAEGLKENGFGRVITCESDAVVYVRAKERIEASGLAGWIDYRNEFRLNLPSKAQLTSCSAIAMCRCASRKCGDFFRK